MANLVVRHEAKLSKIKQMWHLQMVCSKFAIGVNPFLRPVLILKCGQVLLNQKGLRKVSSNLTLHLIKVVKLKRFKKVSSDLKTILMTDLAGLPGSARVFGYTVY